MRTGERHNRDCNRSAVHVDRRAKRDRDRIKILIKAELFTGCHVYRDIGCRASCEECGHTRVFQAAPDKRIGILLQRQESDERIDNQRDRKHCSDKQQKELAVIFEDRKTVCRYVRKNKSHDAKRRQIDNPADTLGNGIGRIRKESLGIVRAEALHRKAKQNCPEQDANVVRVRKRLHRIRDAVHQEIMHDFTDSLRDRVCLCGRGKPDRNRKCKACDDREQGRKEGCQHVQPDDKPEPFVQPALSLRKCAHDQHKDKNRRNRLERADEQIAENADKSGAGDEQSEEQTDNQSTDDSRDQADAVVFNRCCFEKLSDFHVIPSS